MYLEYKYNFLVQCLFYTEPYGMAEWSVPTSYLLKIFIFGPREIAYERRMWLMERGNSFATLEFLQAVTCWFDSCENKCQLSFSVRSSTSLSKFGLKIIEKEFLSLTVWIMRLACLTRSVPLASEGQGLSNPKELLYSGSVFLMIWCHNCEYCLCYSRGG